MADLGLRLIEGDKEEMAEREPISISHIMMNLLGFVTHHPLDLFCKELPGMHIYHSASCIKHAGVTIAYSRFCPSTVQKWGKVRREYYILAQVLLKTKLVEVWDSLSGVTQPILFAARIKDIANGPVYDDYWIILSGRQAHVLLWFNTDAFWLRGSKVDTRENIIKYNTTIFISKPPPHPSLWRISIVRDNLYNGELKNEEEDEAHSACSGIRKNNHRRNQMKTKLVHKRVHFVCIEQDQFGLINFDIPKWKRQLLLFDRGGDEDPTLLFKISSVGGLRISNPSGTTKKTKALEENYTLKEIYDKFLADRLVEVPALRKVVIMILHEDINVKSVGSFKIRQNYKILNARFMNVV
ncbi:hypothetical protein LguiB_026819 [Lonicera macranthoides]